MTIGDPPPGCTCGPYMSVVPRGPCPHHSPMLGYFIAVPVYMSQTTPPPYRYQTTTGTSTVVTWPLSSNNPYAR